MLTLSTIEQLREQGATLEHDVSLGAPVSKNITRLVSSIPRIRHSVRPTARTPDVSNLAIDCENIDRVLSWWDTGSILNGKKWQGTPVTVKLGAGGVLVAVFTGVLNDIAHQENDRTAELICVDRVADLQRNTVHFEQVYTDPDGVPESADETGKLYKDEPVAAIVKDLLTEALGVGELDATSFDDFAAEERGGGERIRWYETPRGTWWSAISGLLSQTNSGIRLNAAGKLEYFKFRPAAGLPVYTLHEGRNLISLVTQHPLSSVVNKYRVQVEDGSGAVVDTANSPVQDATSITDFGEVSRELVTGFTLDAAAESSAEEQLSYTGTPFIKHKAKATIDAMLVELGDLVGIEAPSRGISTTAVVLGRQIDPSGLEVELTMIESDITTEPWLYCDNAQDLDDGQLVW